MPGLEGAWVPVAATLAGEALEVSELRVRYLLLEAGRYRIIDRSNRVVDTGEYRTGSAAAAELDIICHTGMGAGRTLKAIYELKGDELTVGYDLKSGERPDSLEGAPGQLLLRIAYARAALGSAGTAPA